MATSKVYLRVVLMVLLVIIMTSSKVLSAEKEAFTLAVVTQFPPSVIHKHWTPLIQRLSKDTGFDFTLKLYQSIPQFEADLLKGFPDFAFMNPYHQVMAKKAQGYIPLIRDSKPLTGIIVVKSDSPIKDLYDLNGKEIAFPSPNAFAASLYMRALLTEKYKIKFTPRYVTTHTNVYRHVILDKTSAGGGVNNTLMREPDEVKAKLRIIFETPKLSPHPLSAHPRVPKSVKEAVIKAFLDLSKSDDAKDLLTNIQMPTPIKADYKQDYLPIEKLGLEKFVVVGGD